MFQVVSLSSCHHSSSNHTSHRNSFDLATFPFCNHQ